MHRGNDARSPSGCFIPDAVENIELMADVQMCVRLVEKVDQRRLRQGAGKNSPLQLPARKAGDCLATERLQVHQRNRLIGSFNILASFESPGTVSMRYPPEEDRLLDREIEYGSMGLRYIHDPPTSPRRCHLR